ncbi:MAG: hypothetical protein EZS28_048002, partial [Streblomastix strix]
KTEDLKGIPSSQCACEANDLRSECAATQCKSQTIPAQGCICTSSYHPDKCICPSNTQDLNGIPKSNCACINSEDPRTVDCPPLSNPPTEKEPEIQYDEIKVTETLTVEINDGNRNEATNAVENIITVQIDGKDNIGISVPTNEVYEEEIIIVKNKVIILQAQISQQQSASTIAPPVLRPTEKEIDQKQQNSDQNQNPLIHIYGNGDIQIKQFIVEHFQHESNQPLLLSDEDGVLRLDNVTLSKDKHVKDKQTGVIQLQSTNNQITTPYIEARGKLVVLQNVIIEASNFESSSGILLKGSKGSNNHQLLIERSKLYVQSNENNQGINSFLDINGFTSVIKASNFQGINNKQQHANSENNKK